MVYLQTLQSIAYFGPCIRLSHPSGIVCEDEEVFLAREADRIDGSDQVGVHKLV